MKEGKEGSASSSEVEAADESSLSCWRGDQEVEEDSLYVKGGGKGDKGLGPSHERRYQASWGRERREDGDSFHIVEKVVTSVVTSHSLSYHHRLLSLSLFPVLLLAIG
jgi:hypothetical protein